LLPLESAHSGRTEESIHAIGRRPVCAPPSTRSKARRSYIPIPAAVICEMGARAGGTAYRICRRGYSSFFGATSSF
jgi:hypothetical protein